MKSDVETLNPTRVKFTVEVGYDELKPSLDKAYKTIAGQVQVPGFRKGKVPPRVIDQRFGRAAVLEEAVNDALPKFYQQAVEASDFLPLGQPTVDVSQAPDPKDGGDLKFSVEVDVRPVLELPDLESIAVTVDDLQVPEEEVETRLTALRERFGTLTGVDRPAADGDFVSIDLRAEIDGEEIETAKGISYRIGQGNMIEGLDEALTGVAAEGSTTFTAPLAGGERKGQDASITVTVQSVKERVLPEADDDFAQLASEFDTLEELRADLLSQVEQSKKFEQGLQARDKVLEKLLETVEVPVPESLVEAEIHAHLERESRLEDAEHRAEIEDSTRQAIRSQLLLDALADREEIGVEQGELIEYLVGQAQQYGMEPQQFVQMVDGAGQVPSMVSEVRRRKALAVAMEKATVTDASGNPVDLEELVGGTEEDDVTEDATEDVTEDAAPAEEGQTVDPTGDDEQAAAEATAEDPAKS
ncbi:trigger factor [Kineococcus radiotolerans]|uniref:Trigger factor n=1 Tax=Kineococcus radiotolerans (strain ATCC BAA-149 / DSM 14245 / SRS30216) TaxID=266940 RepID=TIG_KINRD|nr:trigger factor [Kineococcus radiotolerans]A6WDU2.1 RecName: Full=Trigger factor; Short=TF; AltName: Full=PPIase [Kineococcus radiotolerans SRS30216 = ATCC BAA-149]ABS04981.1 trigger factor [Kineococcus radiotolerans SRS30216 = ATCC BAA-149]